MYSNRQSIISFVRSHSPSHEAAGVGIEPTTSRFKIELRVPAANIPHENKKRLLVASDEEPSIGETERSTRQMRCRFRKGLGVGCPVLKPKRLDCFNVSRMRWDDTLSLRKLPDISLRQLIDCSGKMDVLNVAGFTPLSKKTETHGSSS